MTHADSHVYYLWFGLLNMLYLTLESFYYNKDQIWTVVASAMMFSLDGILQIIYMYCTVVALAERLIMCQHTNI